MQVNSIKELLTTTAAKKFNDEIVVPQSKHKQLRK